MQHSDLAHVKVVDVYVSRWTDIGLSQYRPVHPAVASSRRLSICKGIGDPFAIEQSASWFGLRGQHWWRLYGCGSYYH